MKSFLARFARQIEKLGINANQVPIYGAILTVVTYFLLDYQFINPYESHKLPEVMGGVSIALLLFTVIYFLPAIKENRSKSTVFKFLMLVMVAIVFTIAYKPIVGSLLPSIFSGYKFSNVVLIVIIAPILEELAFRYLLYDKWAKPKFGTWKAVLMVGLMFVITHPIVNMNGFALYWLPTLLFFSIYDLGGIYPAILAHMLFNIIAIL